MPIILDESLISLAQAARELPSRPNISTIWRWATRGVRGVVLETIVIAGRRYTSREALFQRFVEATTAAAVQRAGPVVMNQRRTREIECAEREFRASREKLRRRVQRSKNPSHDGVMG